jgi:hypothetical protein
VARAPRHVSYADLAKPCEGRELPEQGGMLGAWFGKIDPFGEEVGRETTAGSEGQVALVSDWPDERLGGKYLESVEGKRTSAGDSARLSRSAAR